MTAFSGHSSHYEPMAIIQPEEVALLVAVALGSFAVLVRSVAKPTAGHVLAVALFATYLAGVASFTLLPLRLDDAYRESIGQAQLSASVTLRPMFLGGASMSAYELLGNILLGVPFGFGLPFVSRMSARLVLLNGLVLSALVEGCQLALNVFGLVFPRREADVNDVLLNTLGVAIGIGALALVRSAYRKVDSGPVSSLPVWSHFHERLLA